MPLRDSSRVFALRRSEALWASSAVVYSFKPDWKTSLLVVFLLPLLLGLANWQLQREQEKRQILAQYQQRLAAVPLDLKRSWHELQSTVEASFRRVHLVGKIRPEPLLLLDNKIQHGVVGYQVIQQVVLDDSERTVWLNRGWVAAGRLRSDLPDITTPSEALHLQAHIYVPLGEPFLLAQNSLSADQSSPIIVQHSDIAVFNDVFGAVDGFPYLLRAEQASPAALDVSWPVINTQPEKHRAYAFQWLAMAIALLIFYILRNVERKSD